MASFGETLKRERELREISLRQIAEATKIAIRYLEALEANQFDVLPGGLFNKGFIRAYSRFIGIDGEAMVNTYLQEAGPQPSGTGIALAGNPPSMHRPSGVPQKRAGARPSDPPPSQRQHRPAITFAPTPPARDGAAPGAGAKSQAEPPARAPSPGAQPAGPQSAAAHTAPSRSVESRADRAPAPATHSTPADPVRAALMAIVAEKTESKKSERTGQSSSRALFWILSLVAAAGILFLLLIVLRPSPPAASHPAENPAPDDGGAAVPPSTTRPAPQEGTRQGAQDGSQDATQQGSQGPPDGSSALLPEMSQPSHITLGALTTVPPGATPSNGRLAAAPPGTVARTEPTPRQRPEPRSDREPLAPPTALAPSGPGERGATGSTEFRPSDAGGTDAGPMKVEILVTDRTFVQIVCDGRVTVNRLMEAGETEESRCDSVVRISATDAGAAHVTVNGAPCLPLGDPGSKAYGYTIRVDDFARICPRGERGSRGRR
ncbi:MAG TPA: RodZ domain-containing protein [Candidatus Binatia bacterium]|nr:RodZ domain-containing protein [Candidatus Binatia bacterium]